jgi:hypothetical protein
MLRDEDAASLRRGCLHYLPVVAGKMEFAEEVRKTVLKTRPQVVAVELPATLEWAFLRAIERLPELSIITYSEAKKDESVYLPIEITDPFVEAIRSAQEIGAEIFFIDPDVGERPHLKDLYPDSYALRRLGFEKYVHAYRLYPQETSLELIRHAAGIAWKLQSCDPTAQVLVVISLNLLDPVMEAMQHPQAEPLLRARREELQVLNLHPDCLAEVAVEYPLLQAVYEVRRYGLPAEDPASGGGTSKEHGPFTVHSAGVEDPRRELDNVVRHVARHANWLSHEAAQEAAKDQSQKEPENPPGDASDPVPEDEISTPPERFRLMDRQRLNFRLFAEAEKLYEKSTGEKLAHWQRSLYSRYCRNLALVDQNLIATLFDQTVAARAIVDDNFAWELWQLASSSPFQKTSSDLMTVNVSGEEIWVNMKRIHLRRRLPRAKAKPRPMGLRGRKREKVPGEWAQQFEGKGICSYPPEDIVLENYGLFLKKKGKSVLSEERIQSEPFSTSLLDGIDIRETLRNWHAGKLYVRQFQRVSGEVGAVVVIFDEDRENRYPWCMTWLGEHNQESDMAFYSTDPYNQIVGPGIVRAEYGGFLLSYPPRRMLDVWQDPDYWFAESKPETLLMAGLDYTLERFVVYVASHPPRTIFRSIASRLGKRIIYIPIGQLSPISLKKIRVAHILDGHDKRPIAKDYIW